MKTTRRLGLILALAAASWGCGDGGCGDSGNDSKTVDMRPSAGGGPPPGGGTVSAASRFDTASAGAASKSAAEQLQETVGKASEKLAGPQLIFDVTPDGYSRVLQAKVPALVIVSGPGCADCETVLPSLRTVSKEKRGKIEFYKIDSTALGASGVLPAGMLQPLPGFILYEGGKVVTSRKGLPFARETGRKDRPDEEVAEYQRRLYRWFRDALTQRNLGFGGT